MCLRRHNIRLKYLVLVVFWCCLLILVHFIFPSLGVRRVHPENGGSCAGPPAPSGHRQRAAHRRCLRRQNHSNRLDRLRQCSGRSGAPAAGGHAQRTRRRHDHGMRGSVRPDFVMIFFYCGDTSLALYFVPRNSHRFCIPLLLNNCLNFCYVMLFLP